MIAAGSAHRGAPRVAVVIPCFNQGEYVDEAVDSALAQTFGELEIVVVDDGSTDTATSSKLASYRRPKTRVIRTENQGLAAARNAGIAATSAEYVLPLDADDRIAPTYVAQAVRHLDENPGTGIVYCEAEYFGSKTGRWLLGEYRLPAMLWENVIFCSALFRRADWEATGGYRPAMKFGWEDWDFWLSLVERGRGVHRLPETLFFYRVKDESMAQDMIASRERRTYSRGELVRAHIGLYAENVGDVFRNRAYLERHESVAARVALAALARPWRGFPGAPARAAALLAWAAAAPQRRSK